MGNKNLLHRRNTGLAVACLFVVGLALWWFMRSTEQDASESDLVVIPRAVEETANLTSGSQVVGDLPVASNLGEVSSLPLAVPLVSRQGKWAKAIPPVDEYVGRLPASYKPALEEFQRRYPTTDATDLNAFHAALLAERERYGYELTERSAAQYQAWLGPVEEMQMQLVVARGEYVDVSVSGQDETGRFYTLIGFDGPRPVYSFTQNANAAISTAANLVRMNPSFDGMVGDNLHGSNLYVNVNDHGTIYEHAEFQWPGGGSRIVYKEIYDSGDRSHMTHVAGTVGAYGYVTNALGMAPRLWIRSLIQQSTSDVSTYGMQFPGQLITSPSNQMRSVMGTTSLGSTDSNSNRCVYTSTSASFDSILWDYPYYIHFYAAGNDGSGYSTISLNNPVAKNVMTMGSVTDTTRDENGNYVSGGSVSSFSSRGPAFDGRIKPDFTANGEGLYSPSGATGYGNKTGTSMATPNASGSSVLLIDYVHKRFPGHFMRSSTTKALLMNTADDRGNAGPDYTYGWGIINVRRAAEIIQHYANAPASRVLVEDLLTTGQTHSWTYTCDGTGPIRVSLAWIDRPGTGQSPSTATRDPRLVNDLELRLISPTGVTNFPYVLPFTIGSGGTPAYSDSLRGSAAVRGTNFTDNAEQIYIAAPAAGDYTLHIFHTGTLSGGTQRFSLAVSGMVRTQTVIAAITAMTPATGSVSNALPVSVAGSNFLFGADVIFRRAGSASATAFAPIVVGNHFAGRLDTTAMAKGYWDVVVRNPGGSETVLTNGFLLPIAALLPPVFTSIPPQPATATVAQAFGYTITTSDADTPPANLVLTASGLPAWLVLTNVTNGAGELTGSPGPGDIGSANILLSVTDGSYTTHQALALTVLPAAGNTPPSILTTNLPDAHVGVAYTADVTATDADGHALTLTVSNAPAWLAFTDNGDGTAALFGTPAVTQTGTVSIVITASDVLDSTAQSLSLTVRPRAVVSLGSAAYSVSETNGSVTLTVNRTLNDAGPVSVNYATANGTATAGGDYTAASGTLHWDDGDTAAKTFSVPILDDLATEGNETFTVTLSGLTGIANLGVSSATVTIQDDDNNTPPVVSILSPAGAITGLPNRTNTLVLAGQVTDDGQPTNSTLTVTWSQVSGPASATFAAPAATHTTVTFPADGRYVLRFAATDGEFSNNVTRIIVVGPVPPPVAGTGIAREVFTNIAGSAVINLTTNAKFVASAPDVTGTLTNLFEAPANFGDNYGQRMRGYFIPPQTGPHVFWIASADSSELWLSSDANPSNKVRVALLSGSTGSRNWTNNVSQQSSNITLVAGAAYYIEALHKEGTGSDHVAVGVTLPDATQERPIPVSRLALYETPSGNDAPNVNPGADSNAVVGLAFNLDGSVIDDGKPSGALTSTWTKQTGPGNAAFADAGQPGTSVTFDLAGAYVVRLTATDGATTVYQERTIVVEELSGYDAWIAGYPGVGDQSGPQDDPDGDGLKNFMEYALRLDPTVASVAGQPATKEEAGYLTLTYRKNKDATDVTFVVEGRSGLTIGNWDATGITEIASEDKGDHWLITVRDAVPMSEAGSRFLRLRVSR
jgi:hypothetical protein